MRSRARAAAAVVAGAIIVSACGGGSSDDSSAPADPATTADASTDTEDAGVNSLLNGTVPTVTGSQVDLASFAGQDVLVWVWAPW